MGTTKWKALVATAALGATFAGAAEGQWYRRGDTRDRLRIQGIRVSESADVDVEDADARFEAATGIHAAWEFRWGGAYGLEVAVRQSEHDFVDRSLPGSVQRVGTAELRSVTISAIRHWPIGSRTDLFAGIGISDLASSAVELDVAPGQGFDVTSDPAPAFQLGVDVALTERLALGIGLRVVPREVDVPGGSASWTAWGLSAGITIPIGSR